METNKTLRERIAECRIRANEIIAANPEICNIKFELKDCNIDEIKAFDAKLVVCGDRLLGIPSTTGSNITILAYTKPFKSVKPIEYEF